MTYTKLEQYWNYSDRGYVVYKHQESAIFKFTRKFLKLNNFDIKLPKAAIALANFLHNAQAKQGGWVKITHEALSKLLNCSIPTATTALLSCQRLGLIDRSADQKGRMAYRVADSYYEFLAEPQDYLANWLKSQSVEVDSTTIPTSTYKAIFKPLTYKNLYDPYKNLDPKIPKTLYPSSVSASSYIISNQKINNNNVCYFFCKDFDKENTETEKSTIGPNESNEAAREESSQKLAADQIQPPMTNSVAHEIKQPKNTLQFKHKGRRLKESQIDATRTNESDADLPPDFYEVKLNVDKDAIAELVDGFEKAYEQYYEEMEGENAHRIKIPKPKEIHQNTKYHLLKYDSLKVAQVLSYVYCLLEQGFTVVESVNGLIVQAARNWEQWLASLDNLCSFYQYSGYTVYSWEIGATLKEEISSKLDDLAREYFHHPIKSR